MSPVPDRRKPGCARSGSSAAMPAAGAGAP